MAINVERLHNTGLIIGGHSFKDIDHHFNAPFACAQVAVYDNEGTGLVLDITDVEALIAALRNAMLDG